MKIATRLIPAAALAALSWQCAFAEPGPAPAPAPPSAAGDIADFFSRVGDQIYEDCIYELSDEQIEVQNALIAAYVQRGATSLVARRLAAKQIVLPELSDDCKDIKARPRPPVEIAAPEPEAVPPAFAPPWVVTPQAPPAPAPTPEAAKPAPTPPAAKAPAAKPAAKAAPVVVSLAGKKVLPQWDCAPGVDFVTIKRDGYERKLTGGEICNPFQDVHHAVPASLANFRFGYTIRTGRLFVVSEDPSVDGRTVAWAISGREVCRNNPDPDCLAARAIGPLPPGEYAFASSAAHRLNWGPKTKRMVAGVFLKKLWHRTRFSKEHVAGMLARGNIAFHVRLKGEMSEACLGLEPKAWGYVASLIKDGRATGLNVYIDEPHPQVTEAPPTVTASSFSLTSLFSN